MVVQHVTIGVKRPGEIDAPSVGNYLYIGAGTAILEHSGVGDQATINANAGISGNVPADATVGGASGDPSIRGRPQQSQTPCHGTT